MDRISEQKNEWADRGNRPSSRGEKKKAMLLNQIFSLCSVCRHNGCFSLEKLTGWHFLLWDGPVQIRGNWFNGSALMAQKATSSVDTFLFSLFFPFFFCLLPALALFFPSLSGLHLIFFIFCAARIVKDAGVFVSECGRFCGRQFGRRVLRSIAAVLKPAHTASGPTGCSVNRSWYTHTRTNRTAVPLLRCQSRRTWSKLLSARGKKKSVMLEQF